MDIEVIIVNEVSQAEEKHIPYDTTHIWNLKYDTKGLIETDLWTKKQTHGCRRESSVGEKLGVWH